MVNFGLDEGLMVRALHLPSTKNPLREAKSLLHFMEWDKLVVSKLRDTLSRENRTIAEGSNAHL